MTNPYTGTGLIGYDPMTYDVEYVGNYIHVTVFDVRDWDNRTNDAYDARASELAGFRTSVESWLEPVGPGVFDLRWRFENH